jgi:Predicted carbamoyl transferase, NodU family
LGNQYSNKKIKDVLDKYNITYKKSNLKKVARLISEKKIVGWFQGRSEYGPRSLGNRSILADSRGKDTKDILNNRVKHRESYRPFAPSILEENCNQYFELDVPSPYMLLIAKVKKNTIPAVTHVDNTARVQTVTKNTNTKFYNLIKEFNKITNVPCILNTSFNDAGDPIVETPEDALYTLMKCDMDYLYIGDFLIERKKVLNNTIRKKIDLDIKKNIDAKRDEIIKKYFKNYSKKEKEKFINLHNKKSTKYLLYTAKIILEKN